MSGSPNKPTRDTALPGVLMRLTGSRYALVYVAAAAAVLLVAAFSPALGARTFTDAPDSALRLPLASHVKHLPRIFDREFMVFTHGRYRPLPHAILSVPRTFVAADSPVFWHGWLLSFHVLNAAMVYAIARQFARGSEGALLAAGVFLLHPLVSAFGSQPDLFAPMVAGSFALGTFLLLLRFGRAGGWWRCVLALALFAGGLLSSSTVLMVLPLVFLCEVLFFRTKPLKTLAALLPFVALAGLFAIFTRGLSPHPNFWVAPTPAFGPERWYRAFAFTGGGLDTLRGLVAGWSVPVSVGTWAGSFHAAWNAAFITWSVILLVALVATLVGLWMRTWLFVGFYLILLGALPRFGLTENLTRDYAAWSARYLPLVGLALFAGALIELLLRFGGRRWRLGVLSAGAVLVALSEVFLIHANIHTRTPLSYWRFALAQNPDSEIASVALGKVYLARDDETNGLAYLFGPAVKDFRRSSLAMARYYSRKGQHLAAVVHVNAAAWLDWPGFLYQENMLTKADVMLAANAADYAETALGWTLMADVHNTAALRRLARLLAMKGYLPAAVRYLRKAHDIDPSDPETSEMLENFSNRLYSPEQYASDDPVIVPPTPDWLRYVTQQGHPEAMQSAVVKLAEAHPSDPMILLSSGIGLSDAGRHDEAIGLLEQAVHRMPAVSLARVAECHAAANAVSDRKMSAAARSAYRKRFDAVLADVGPLYLRDAEEWRRMAYLQYKAGNLDLSLGAYRVALKADPDLTEAHANIGGILVRQGQFDEAMPYMRRALTLAPDEPAKIHANLAYALMKTAHTVEALEQFAAAIDADRTIGGSYLHMAVIFESQGRYERCVEVLEKGLVSASDTRAVKRDLAKYLAAAPVDVLRDGRRAVALLEPVCDSADVTPLELDVLAAAYAETGQFRVATATAARAAALARATARTCRRDDPARADGLDLLARQIDARARIYERGGRLRLRRGPTTSR